MLSIAQEYNSKNCAFLDDHVAKRTTGKQRFKTILSYCFTVFPYDSIVLSFRVPLTSMVQRVGLATISVFFVSHGSALPRPKDVNVLWLALANMALPVSAYTFNFFAAATRVIETEKCNQSKMSPSEYQRWISGPTRPPIV